MEDEAPPRRSVAELAGRFKGSSAPPNHSVAAGNEAEKPVRRRPPRSLHLPKAHEDGPETPDGASSVPPKAKRNSALIEKLQANLSLSPTGPPLKSPGTRMLPLTFSPPSPGSAPDGTSSLTTPTSPTAASPLTEEGPTSFEAPPTAAEGVLLQSVSKGRARVSIRRRPPSRRHRKSSSSDVYDTADGQPNTQTETEDTAGGGGRGGAEEEEVFKEEGQTNEPGAPESKESNEEEKSASSSEVKEEDDASSPLREEEDKGSKQEDGATEEDERVEDKSKSST